MADLLAGLAVGEEANFKLLAYVNDLNAEVRSDKPHSCCTPTGQSTPTILVPTLSEGGEAGRIHC